MCVLYSNTCRSMNGVYFICHLPPYYDGILTDPRDLRPCPQCCQPDIGGISLVALTITYGGHSRINDNGFISRKV